MATKRMIGLPTQNTQTPYNGVGSNITGGSGITKIPVPSSVSNPASLTPGVTTPKPMFSDNIAKPAGTATPPTTPVAPITTPITTPAVNKPTPQATPQVTPQATPQVTPTATQPGMLDINDPNNYNLTGYTVDDFLKLDPASQLKANEFGKSQNLRLQDTTNKLNYTNEVNANKDFLDKQNTINQETAKLNNQNAEIQRQQNMRAEEKSVRDLAQNVGFLGSQGRPVKSAGMMNAYADAINESNQKLNEIRTIQDNMRSMQELGIEFDANQYTEQIRRLNQDLKDKTGQVFQDAINAYNAEERAGMIDSPSKMLKLQQEILARADFSVAGFVQKNLDDIRVMNDNITSHIEAVKVETERAEVLRKEQAQTQAEFVKNQNTVNKDMSQALGHYVNGNGQALTTTEGAIIPFAKDMPNPSYDPNTGVAVVRQPDAQGNPVPVIQQIAPMSQDYKMGLQLKQAQLNKIQQETASAGGNIVNTQISNPNTQISIAQYSQQQRGRTTLQCGELVNDYIKKESGTKGSLGNSFADKVAGIDKIGRSVSPVVGGIFAFDIKTSQGNTGHTGIVTGVNPDGSINVLEANRKENSANGGVPDTGTYTPAQVKNMVFSQAPTNENLMMEAQSLVAGMGGTGEERNQYAKNLIQVAQEKGISIKDAKAELGLRTKTDDDFIKQRTDQYGDLRDAGSALSQVRSAIDLLNDPNGTNDLIGIVGLLKSIDPRSVARSDEVDNVANARSVIASMEVKLNKLKSGQLLNPDQRKQLQKSMQTMVNAYEKKNTDFKKTVVKDFDTRGLDSNILFGSEDVQAGRSGIANDIALQAGGINNASNSQGTNPYAQYQKR